MLASLIWQAIKVFNRGKIKRMSLILKIVKKAKEKLNNIIKKIGESASLSTFFVFTFFLAINSLVYLTVSNVSSFDDQWFHFKFAYLLRTQGWQVVSNFKWLYFTNLAQDNLNYGVTLYHYFLVPFTFFSDKILGMKIAGIIIATLPIAMMFYVLREMKIKRAFLWVIFFYVFASYNVVWRMLIGRNFILIDGLIILEIYFIFRRKYFPLFITAIIHTWWHPGTFWIVPLFVLAYEAVRYVNQQKLYYFNILSGLTGSILGFALMPPNSDHLFAKMTPWDWTEQITKFLTGTMTGKLVVESTEGKPAEILNFVTQNENAFILLSFFVIICIVLYVYRKKNDNCDMDNNSDRIVLREFLFLITIIFFLGNVCITIRFEDLLMPVSFLGIIIIFQFLSENKYIHIRERAIRIAAYATLLIVSLYFLMNRFLDIRQNIGNNENYLAYEKVGNWLVANTKKNDIIFNTSFDQFPTLFFYDDWNYYIYGINPEGLYDYSQNMYWLYYNITSYGLVCEKEGDCQTEFRNDFANKNDEETKNLMIENSNEIYPIIKDTFKSKYVYFSGDTFLRKELDSNKERYEPAYEDKDSGIYVYSLK